MSRISTRFAKSKLPQSEVQARWLVSVYQDPKTSTLPQIHNIQCTVMVCSNPRGSLHVYEQEELVAHTKWSTYNAGARMQRWSIEPGGEATSTSQETDWKRKTLELGETGGDWDTAVERKPSGGEGAGSSGMAKSLALVTAAGLIAL